MLLHSKRCIFWHLETLFKYKYKKGLNFAYSIALASEDTCLICICIAPCSRANACNKIIGWYLFIFLLLLVSLFLRRRVRVTSHVGVRKQLSKQPIRLHRRFNVVLFFPLGCRGRLDQVLQRECTYLHRQSRRACVQDLCKPLMRFIFANCSMSFKTK